MSNRTFLVATLAAGMLAISGPVLAQGHGSGGNSDTSGPGGTGVSQAPGQDAGQNSAAPDQTTQPQHKTKHKHATSKPANDIASGPAAVTNGATKGR